MWIHTHINIFSEMSMRRLAERIIQKSDHHVSELVFVLCEFFSNSTLEHLVLGRPLWLAGHNACKKIESRCVSTSTVTRRRHQRRRRRRGRRRQRLRLVTFVKTARPTFKNLPVCSVASIRRIDQVRISRELETSEPVEVNDRQSMNVLSRRR